MDDEVATMLALLNDGFPAVEELSGPEARALVAARAQPVSNLDDVRSTEDLHLPGIEPHPGEVPARLYHPHGSEGVRTPAIVFFHGGGFVFCSVDSHDGFCRMLARKTGCRVLSVDYRLAPEHPAPTAAYDALAAVRHVSEHAEGLGIDPACILTAGDSAGGNLAAVVALMCRDLGGPSLAAQILIYPVIEPDFETESYRRFGVGHFNTRAAMEWYWRNYLGGEELPAPAEYVAPLRAASLAGLPPAVVVTAGHDPLCSEGTAYAAALAGAGVRVRHRSYPELFHGFLTIGPFGPAASARDILWSDVRALLPQPAPLGGSAHA